jgi:hypothetical protein
MLAVSGKQAKGIEMPKCGKPAQLAQQVFSIIKHSQNIVKKIHR